MIEIEVKNITDITTAFEKLQVKNTLNSAIKKSILMLERTSKINTPVKTGLLRNSYETSFGDLEGTLRNFREYAPYVEARRGFLSMSVMDEEQNIKDLFENDINALLKNIS